MKDANLNTTGIYTEFSGLNALKVQARTDKDAALETVARQFEGLFMSTMLKSMRDANKVFSEGNFMQSNQTEFYEQMFDSQLTLSLSEKKGFGLANTLMRQLRKPETHRPEAEVAGGQVRRSIKDYPRNLPSLSPRLPTELKKVDEVLAAEVEKRDLRVMETTKAVEESLRVARAPLRMPTPVQTPLAVNEVVAATEAPVMDAAEDAEPASLPARFNSPAEFVAGLMPLARKAASESGLDPRLLVAQAALETGWGRHMIENGPGQPSHNLFGIKADSRWSGSALNITTTEFRGGVAMKERAAFRAYPDYEASFRDYVQFLQENPRYKNVWAKADNPHQFAVALQDAGYATDPAYGNKIGRILNGGYLRASLDVDAGMP